MNKMLWVKNGENLWTFYAKKDCGKVVNWAIKDIAEGIEKISGATSEVIYIEKLSAVKHGIIVARFEDDEEIKNLFVQDFKELLGTDGFCVRRKENIIYVLSHSEQGVSFGLHDFLEKNADIVWCRGALEYEVETLPSKDIYLNVCDYLEVSPFRIRIWNPCGIGTNGQDHEDDGTARYLGRNKLNGTLGGFRTEWYEYGLTAQSAGVKLAVAAGLKNFRNIDDLVEEHPEYFMANADGTPKTSTEDEGSFINFYNKEVPKVMARRMADYLLHDPSATKVLGIAMPDNPYFCMMENGKRLDKEPFTADDGTTVTPDQANYKSTVYFNYMNRIAKELNAIIPNTYFYTLAYMYSEWAPDIEVDEHILIKIAPLSGNVKHPISDEEHDDNLRFKENILKWVKKSKGICMNSYWNSFKGNIYTQPVLPVVQADLLWFQKIGVYGLTPEGKLDCSIVENMSPRQKFARNFYDMNEALTWVVFRLMWNPSANVEALLQRYCRIVYKEIAEEMYAYFKLIEKGWNSSEAFVWYATGADVYIYQFIIQAGIKDELLAVLKKAKDKAFTPTVKAKIDTVYSIVLEQIQKYETFVKEEAEVTYCQGEDVLSQQSLDYQCNENSVWNKAKPLCVLRDYTTLEYYNQAAKFNCRMLYDDENIYFGFTVYDDELAKAEVDANGELRLYREDGTPIISRAETYIGGNNLNQQQYYGYISGFKAREIVDHWYLNAGTPKGLPIPSGVQDVKFAHTHSEPEKRYYFHVQVVPLKALGVNIENFNPYGHFVYYTNRYGRAGWMGFGLWSKQNFSNFKLKK